MASYMPQGNYSLLGDMNFQDAYDRQKSMASATPDGAESDIKLGMDKDTRSAAASGMASGGLTGGLMSAGIASGNPYLIGGSLILGQIEQAQKAKAQAEQEKINNEKERRARMTSQYNKMADMSFGV